MPDKRNRAWYCGNCLTTFEGDMGLCPNLGCRSPKPGEGWGLIYESDDIIDRHYRVLRRLATGGAGVTYLAREIGAEGVDEGPELAVKVLYTNRDHGSYLRRLSQEAQILQELAHPHIVEYRGFVHRSGHSPYLVTRFEKGGSLLDHIRRRGALSIPEAALICKQVLTALDRAHQVGVVHRDLKPENVLLEQIPETGQVPVVRVADFGIAKVAGTLSDRLTRVGAFVGTPQFAAPEQFDGLPPGPATDVFAAGGLLYFCVARQPLLPFGDRMSPEDARELLLSRLPPRLKLPAEPPARVAALELVLADAMAVAPENRLSVREMERMLEALATDQELMRPAPTMIPPDKESLRALLQDPALTFADYPDPPKDRVEVWAPPPAPPAATTPGTSPEPPKPESRPAPPAPAVKPRKKRSLLKTGCVFVILALLCAGGAGVAALDHFGVVSFPVPDLHLPFLTTPAGTEEAPRALTGHERGASRKLDYEAILTYSARKSAEAALACDSREPVLLDLVLDGGGRVVSANAEGGSAAGACVRQIAQNMVFPRVESDVVRLRLQVDPRR